MNLKNMQMRKTNACKPLENNNTDPFKNIIVLLLLLYQTWRGNNHYKNNFQIMHYLAKTNADKIPLVLQIQPYFEFHDDNYEYYCNTEQVSTAQGLMN